MSITTDLADNMESQNSATTPPTPPIGETGPIPPDPTGLVTRFFFEKFFASLSKTYRTESSCSVSICPSFFPWPVGGTRLSAACLQWTVSWKGQEPAVWRNLSRATYLPLKPQEGRGSSEVVQQLQAWSRWLLRRALVRDHNRHGKAVRKPLQTNNKSDRVAMAVTGVFLRVRAPPSELVWIYWVLGVLVCI